MLIGVDLCELYKSETSEVSHGFQLEWKERCAISIDMPPWRSEADLLLSGRLKVDRVFIAERSPSGNGRAERFAST